MNAEQMKRKDDWLSKRQLTQRQKNKIWIEKFQREEIEYLNSKEFRDKKAKEIERKYMPMYAREDFCLSRRTKRTIKMITLLQIMFALLLVALILSLFELVIKFV